MDYLLLNHHQMIIKKKIVRVSPVPIPVCETPHNDVHTMYTPCTHLVHTMYMLLMEGGGSSHIVTTAVFCSSAVAPKMTCMI